MNRPGPQRQPNLAPSPAMGGPFRGPYPTYGMPPRNMMQGYPGMPNHRQNILPQPSPGFIQQRTQSNFPFGAGAASLQQQQSQQPPIQHAPQQQTQQSTANANTTLPPHLSQNTTSGLNTAPSVSSASELGLDPNDFPALGSAPISNTTNTTITTSTTAQAAQTGTSLGSSYASQAGTALGQGANGTPGGGATVAVSGAPQARDFTPDDFPALGGQTQTQNAPPHTQNSQDSNVTVTAHPPGLNGFPHSATDHQTTQQQRQNLLGSMTGLQGQSQQHQPGMLTLGQSRTVHAGFQSDGDKQRNNFSLKLNQNNHAAAAAWNSPNPGMGTGGFPTSLQNGAQQQNHLSTQQQQHHIQGPPGVPPPSSFSQQPHQSLGASHQFDHHTPANNTSSNTTAALPQTPAQQILMSAADRWGLLGLIAMIKNADLDSNLLSIGTDLGTMGLDMEHQGNLYSTFITPWSDSSAAHSVEPDFHLPPCYNVQPPPPGPNKAAAFSDETLFFMFYSSPRDALQEIAAQELWNRNWRFHKDMRLWLTKETGTSPSQKVPGGEQGSYTFWDPENWEKQRKELTVMYADLEEKSQPAFAPGPTLQQNPSVQGLGGQIQPPQAAHGQRTQFQGVGIAGL